MGRRNGTPTIQSRLIDLPAATGPDDTACEADWSFNEEYRHRIDSVRSAVYKYARDTGKLFTVTYRKLPIEYGNPAAGRVHFIIARRLK